MELLPQPLLLTETGFCSSTNARLGAMFGEGLVLVTSGDISCFRQRGRACRCSEVGVGGGQPMAGQVGKWKTKRVNEWNGKLMSEMIDSIKQEGLSRVVSM